VYIRNATKYIKIIIAMKNLLLQYARHNLKANKLFAGALCKLDENQLDMEIVSSFPSIRKTITHIWGAEDIWVQRLQLVEHAMWVANDFTGDIQQLTEHWITTSEALVNFTEKQFSDVSFEHVMMYYNLNKEPVKLQVSTALMHVFNHSTYHRGQLVTMMRQAGVAKIPRTDLFILAQK
jgi:uncharacterized damage-inducible protein DinB